MALCFEIRINQEEPVLAGLEHINVLTAAVTFVSAHAELEFRVGGLVSTSSHDNEHVDWVDRTLQRGDQVAIRLVDAPNPSPPIHREREDPELAAKEEREYYERLKKRYEP